MLHIVDGDQPARLMGVHEVIDEEGLILDPSNAARAVAPQHRNARAALGLPCEEGLAPLRRFHVEDDGAEEEDQMLGRDGEVMHHEGHAGLDRNLLHDPPRCVDPAVYQEGRAEGVVEHEHLAAYRIDPGMGGHRLIELAREIVETGRLQRGSHLIGQAALVEREDPPGVADDVGVGDVLEAVRIAVRRHVFRIRDDRIHEPAVDRVPCAPIGLQSRRHHEAVAIAHAPLLEDQRMDHAVAVEGVGIGDRGKAGLGPLRR